MSIASADIAIMERLAQDASVGAIVGTGVNARIYPQAAPQKAPLPYIVVNLIGGDHTQPLGGTIGYRETRLQIDGFSENYAEMRQLAKAVFDSITSITNPTSVTVGSETYTLYCGKLDSDLSELVEPQDASDRVVRRFLQEYTIHQDYE